MPTQGVKVQESALSQEGDSQLSAVSLLTPNRSSFLNVMVQSFCLPLCPTFKWAYFPCVHAAAEGAEKQPCRGQRLEYPLSKLFSSCPAC